MSYPNFHYEKMVWEKDFKFIAGIDEVGRGAFAGPVVAGCVVYKKNERLKENNVKIDDSKRLSAGKRFEADTWIKENCLTWGIGEVSAHEIDRLGIVKATRKAMRKAIGNANQRLHSRIQYLLIDAFYLPYTRGIKMPAKSYRSNKKYIELSGSNGRQKAIVKGDQKSFSIASASIIAKVYRDNLMTKLGIRKKYKKYEWSENKGYGTEKHRVNILKYGLTLYHRKSFINLSDLKKECIISPYGTIRK